MYSSLHNHTMYSILDGFSTPEEYLEKAKKIGLKAFAITEHGNIYSWLYFGELHTKYPDIKILYGNEVYETENINIQDKDNKYYHLIIIAKNEQGRIALNQITTRSNFEGFYYKPRIDLNMLKPYANDLIVCSACIGSKLGKENNYSKCLEYIKEYKSIFPYFYLELQSHKTEEQIEYNKKLLQLSKDTNTDFIITTDSHVIDESDLYYQTKFIQIARDNDIEVEIYDGCYLQTEQEIHKILDSQIGEQNVCIGLENTNKISDLCEQINMPFQDPILPHYSLPKEFTNENRFLQYLIKQGWNERKINLLSENEKNIYKERMFYEFDIITKMGFSGYYIIVWDYMNFAKSNNMFITAGRGSGAGSLIAYLLNITNVNPIKYNLIFERFLNPERVSMPDFDIDFGNRDIIVNYIEEKYKKENVCQIINFSYITPNVAISDTARMLGINYKVAKKLSDLFKYDTFEEALEKNPNIIDKYPQYLDLFNIAQKISGRVRNVSQHAAGIAIANNNLNNYLACIKGKDDKTVIQCDKKMIEKIGLVKFDILGVETINIIQNTTKLANISYDELSIDNPKMEYDIESFKIINELNTKGLFQIESAGMIDLIKNIRPKTLLEMSDIIALFRPDAMQFCEPYINAKIDKKNIKYIHNDMASILDETNGVCIYQEQLLDIVKKFGNRTYGGADLFRRGIGKKDKELVKFEADKLYDEIITNGYTENIAKQISNDLAQKGGYMFNKSHSLCYSVLCLQTAYLKSHYPIEFYTSLLNSNLGKPENITKYIQDAKNQHSFNRKDIEIMVPNINTSEKIFSITKDKKILFGLLGINGIGETIIKQIITERKDNGLYKNLIDLINRVPKLNTKQVVQLIKSGAIPCNNKRKLINNFIEYLYEPTKYEDAKTIKTQKIMLEEYGIDCNIIKDKDERLKLYNIKRKEKYDELEKNRKQNFINENSEKYLQNEEYWEFEGLSIFLNNNPFEQAFQYLRPFDEIDSNGGIGTTVGIISNVIKKMDKNKKQFCYITLYSVSGLLEMICWHTQLKDYNDLISKKSKVAIRYKKQDDNRIVLKQMKSYDDWFNNDLPILKRALDNFNTTGEYDE